MLLEVIETIQRDAVISFPFLWNLTLNPPAYFTLFGRRVYFSGVLIALGFLLAMSFCARRSKRFGIRSDDFYDLMLWLIPLSILGARLYFVLFRLRDYAADPISALYVWEGGLAIYGGVIAGVITALLVCRRKKIPFPAMIDLLVFGLLIGQIIGRWGNFMNREAFGAETESFFRMGLTKPDGSTIYVHPTFLYESVWNLAGLIFLLLFEGKGKRRYDGQCALIYFFWYGLGRAWIEGLRTDSLYIGGSGIRVSQLLSILLVLAAGTMLVIQGRREHPPEKLYVNRVNSENKETGAEAAAEKQEV